MKVFTSIRRRSRGFTLIECLVYISVMPVFLGIGLAAFYRCWDDNKAITRNSNDIIRTLKAGEAWRADIRAATGPIRVATTNSEQTLRIPTGKNELVYSFANGEVRKRTGEESPWRVVLPNVKSSQVEIDKRDQVTAWRWELELQSQRKNAKVRPLFTFEAVPANPSVP
jgi:prepilin-type N-terminal cleavage/methylation domain-containing protein